LFWHAIQVRSPTGTLGGGPDAEIQRFVVDTKAMRKFPVDMSIYACVELVETGTAVVRVAFDSRALFLLP